MESNNTTNLDGIGNPIPDNFNPNVEDKGSESTEVIPTEVKRVGRFATLVNLMNGLIGAGIVGVPATFALSGVGPTIILIIISATLCYLCGGFMIELLKELNAKGLDDIAYKSFGTNGQNLLGFGVIFFSISCTVAYLIIGASKLSDWLSVAGYPINSNGKWATLVFIYSCVIPIPLTIPRELGFLSKFSMATVACILYYITALLIKSIHQLGSNGVHPTSIGIKVDSGLFTAFSIHCLTFALPVIMMPLIAPYNPSVKKRKIVTGFTYILSFISVAIPGCLAYLVNGSNTKGDVLSSYSKDDVLIITVQVAMFFVVTFSYPIIVVSIVGSLGQIFYQQNIPELLTLKQRFILIPIVNIINLIIAMFIKNITPVLGVGGSLGGCLVVFFFPSIVKLKITKNHWSSPENIMHICIALFGIFSAIVCTYFSVADAIKKFS